MNSNHANALGGSPPATGGSHQPELSHSLGEENDSDTRYEVALTLLEKHKPGSRQNTRVFIDAAILAFTYCVPTAARPRRWQTSERLLAQLTDDPMLAAKSLDQYLNTLTHAETSGPGADPDLLALWTRYDEASAHRLLNRDALIAHAVALAAVTPKPRKSPKLFRKFHTAVQSLSATEGWQELSVSLTAAFIASEYVPAPPDRARPEGPDEGRITYLQNRCAYQALLSRASAYSVPGLGTTNEQIHDNLARIADQVLGNDTAIEGQA